MDILCHNYSYTVYPESEICWTIQPSLAWYIIKQNLLSNLSNRAVKICFRQAKISRKQNLTCELLNNCRGTDLQLDSFNLLNKI